MDHIPTHSPTVDISRAQGSPEQGPHLGLRKNSRIGSNRLRKNKYSLVFTNSLSTGFLQQPFKKAQKAPSGPEGKDSFSYLSKVDRMDYRFPATKYRIIQIQESVKGWDTWASEVGAVGVREMAPEARFKEKQGDLVEVAEIKERTYEH